MEPLLGSEVFKAFSASGSLFFLTQPYWDTLQRCHNKHFLTFAHANEHEDMIEQSGRRNIFVQVVKEKKNSNGSGQRQTWTNQSELNSGQSCSDSMYWGCQSSRPSEPSRGTALCSAVAALSVFPSLLQESPIQACLHSWLCLRVTWPVCLFRSLICSWGISGM